MRCPNCGKDEHVTIGANSYCANCGALVNQNQAATQSAPVTPTTPSGSLVDIARPTAAPQIPRPVEPTPAAAFHTPPQPSQPAQLSDLRPTTPSAPSPEPAANPVATLEKPTDVTLQATSTPLVVIPTSRVQARLERAASVQKSELVKKFLNPAPVETETSMTPETVTPPVAPAALPEIPAVAVAPAPEVPTTPVIPQPVAEPVSPPAPPVEAAPMPVTPTTVRPAAPSPAPPYQPASQKTMPPVKKLTPGKLTSLAAVALSTAIIGSYVWMQNYPKMSIKIAANKAGIAANVPNYLPSGYKLSGPVGYAPGQVVLTFNSSSHKDTVVLTQHKTDWNSSSLVDNYVAKNGKYTTIEDQGLSIYLYGNNHASWINGGIWYSLEGTANLTEDQILKVVGSL